MKIGRRGAVPIRPLPLLLGTPMLVFGLARGLAWQWQPIKFTGNLLVQITLPDRLLVVDGPHALGLLALVAGFGLVVSAFFVSGRRSRVRFFPLTFQLGLFLTVYGVIFLFDLAVRADSLPGGFVVFLSFEYANLMARPIQGTIGLLVLAMGLLVTLRGAFGAPKAPNPDALPGPFLPTAPPPDPRRVVEEHRRRNAWYRREQT